MSPAECGVGLPTPNIEIAVGGFEPQPMMLRPVLMASPIPKQSGIRLASAQPSCRLMQPSQGETMLLRKLTFLTALTTSALMVTATTGWAYPNNTSDVPFGRIFSCTMCHQAGTFDKVNLTPFGVDSRGAMNGARVVAWSQLYALDSDNDTYSNGDELGDPNGQWVRGQPNPTFLATDPNDPTKFPLDEPPPPPPTATCGDNQLQNNEPCDGTRFHIGMTYCTDFGYDNQILLACTNECLRDFSACIGNGTPHQFTPADVGGDGNGDGNDQLVNVDAVYMGCASTHQSSTDYTVLLMIIGTLLLIKHSGRRAGKSPNHSP